MGSTCRRRLISADASNGRRGRLALVATFSIAAFSAAFAGVAVQPVVASVAPAYLSTLAGPSTAPMYPSGLIWDPASQLLVVADTGRNRISVFNPSSSSPAKPVLQFGSYGTGNGQFNTPRDVAVDAASDIFVADAVNSRIQAFNRSGTWLWTAGGPGTCPACLNVPLGLSYDTTFNQVLVADTGSSVIKAYNPSNGAFLWTSNLVTGTISAPREVRRGPDGGVWVTDYHHEQVKAFRVTSTGSWASTPIASSALGCSAPAPTNSMPHTTSHSVRMAPPHM